MKKIIFASLLCLILVAGAFVGCSDKTNDAEKEKEKQKNRLCRKKRKKADLQGGGEKGRVSTARTKEDNFQHRTQKKQKKGSEKKFLISAVAFAEFFLVVVLQKIHFIPPLSS